MSNTPLLIQLSFGAISGVIAKLGMCNIFLFVLACRFYVCGLFLISYPCSIGVMPLDTVKKRMQMSGVARPSAYGEMLVYKNTLDCILQVAKKEGIRGFYKVALS